MAVTPTRDDLQIEPFSLYMDFRNALEVTLPQKFNDNATMSQRFAVPFVPCNGAMLALMLRRVALIVLLGHSACGGLTAGAGPDASAEGQPSDAGSPRCSTPEGWEICGSGTGCSVGGGRPGCAFCVPPACTPDGSPWCGGVGLCQATFDAIGHHGCPVCDDESACYTVLGGSGTYPDLACIPFSLAVLLSPYVQDPDKLRYADLGRWDARALPSQATCPVPAGFQVCGGACGTCSPGQRCVGRSPRHPYGFCVDDLTDWCHSDGSHKCTAPGTGPFGCFIFTVEPEAQPIANQYGICLPVSKCQAVATQLPGGGTCTPQ
jgi:hypothetical protein